MKSEKEIRKTIPFIDIIASRIIKYLGINQGSERLIQGKLQDIAGDFPGGPVVKTLPSNAGAAGLIPVQEAKIPHASWPKKQSIKQKQYCNKFKNGPHQKYFKK